MISKIVSGGQTGVDRAALKFAIDNNIDHGGFCPKGRRSENGRIPDRFKLIETSSSGYRQRTGKNVQHSDGTLIISRGKPTGGTLLTVNTCTERNKPRFIINTNNPYSADEFVEWVKTNNVLTLNVAGPREEKQGGIGKVTIEVLTELFAKLRELSPAHKTVAPQPPSRQRHSGKNRV